MATSIASLFVCLLSLSRGSYVHLRLCSFECYDNLIDEVEEIWKDAIKAYFQVSHFPAGNEENHEKSEAEEKLSKLKFERVVYRALVRIVID
jgi:hypothetical protein